MQASLSNLSGRDRTRLKMILTRIEQEQDYRKIGLIMDCGPMGFIRDVVRAERTTWKKCSLHSALYSYIQYKAAKLFCVFCVICHKKHQGEPELHLGLLEQDLDKGHRQGLFLRTGSSGHCIHYGPESILQRAGGVSNTLQAARNGTKPARNWPTAGGPWFVHGQGTWIFIIYS